MMAEAISFMRVCLETMRELKKCERLVDDKEKLREVFDQVAWIYGFNLKNLKRYESGEN